MSKRTLENFFAPTAAKKAKIESKQPPKKDAAKSASIPSVDESHHATYPWPIPHLPPELAAELSLLVTAQGTSISNQPHLDLLYFQPFIPRPLANELFNFLRTSLPFYRVRYNITRFGKEVLINTPRYTTVFGLDDTSMFLPSNCPTHPSEPTTIIDAVNKTPVHPKKYKASPRPIPQALALLQQITSAATNTSYNFCLVNYYADGSDSISYHSDDERFLGPNPAIASFSLGAPRDFLMKHKPPLASSSSASTTTTTTSTTNTATTTKEETKTYPNTAPLKFPLGSGDMILMRGETQANWLHSIPKRTTKPKLGPRGGGVREENKGRINITFRKAMVPGGTENYYRYNVGDGAVWRWDEGRGEMREWELNWSINPHDTEQ